MASGTASETQPSSDPWAAALDRLLTVTLALAVTAVALQTAVHLLNAAFLRNPQLSVLGEGNATTWASSVATFAAAFVAALHATMLPERRRTFVFLASVFAFFSLDDMVLLHERISERLLELVGLSRAWDSVLWPALYLPLGAVTLLLLVGIARTAPPAPAASSSSASCSS